MSLFDYRCSVELGKTDPPFYGLLMAALRKADTDNFERFRLAWPALVEEFSSRYNAPGGVLPGDPTEVTP